MQLTSSRLRPMPFDIQALNSSQEEWVTLKETHTAVMLDCWNQKLGKITIENKPSEFSKLTRKVSRFETEEKKAIYGLENAYGYGRSDSW